MRRGRVLTPLPRLTARRSPRALPHVGLPITHFAAFLALWRVGVGDLVVSTFDPDLAARRTARGLSFGRLACRAAREVYVIVAMREHVVAIVRPATVTVRSLISLAELTRFLVTAARR